MSNQLLAQLYRQLWETERRQMGGTPEEIAYEAEFATAVNLPLTQLYETGVAILPEAPENASTAELEAFLYLFLLISPASQRLLDVLVEFLIDGFELGGQGGLEDLGIDEEFALTNQGLIDQIETYATELRAQLVQTTAQDIAGQVERHKQAGLTDWVMIGMLILSWAFARTLVRSGWIAMNEGVWATRFAAVETYRRNGVNEVEFVTQRDDRVDDPCLVLDGNIYPVNAIPLEARPPIHLGCRCDLEPVTDDWEPPTTIWTGG